jgi:hypothetical protein
MNNKQQNPAILIKDEHGKVTHALIQDTDTGEKTFYKLETLSLEELAELIK